MEGEGRACSREGCAREEAVQPFSFLLAFKARVQVIPGRKLKPSSLLLPLALRRVFKQSHVSFEL